MATANLAEAEGRALRHSVLKVGVIFAGLVASLAMVLTGFGLLLAALFWAVSAWSVPTPFGLHPSWAYLVCSGVCVLTGAGLAWITSRLAR